MAVIAYELEGPAQTPGALLAFLEFDATITEGHASSVRITDHPVEDGSNVSDHVRSDPERLVLEVHVTNTPVRFPPNVMVSQNTAYNSVNKLADEREAYRARTKGSPTGSLQPLTLKVPTAKHRLGGPQVTSGFSATRLLGLRIPGIKPTATPSPISPGVTQFLQARTLQFDAEFDRVHDIYEELIRLMNAGVVVRVLTYMRDYTNMTIRTVDTTRVGASGSGAAFQVTLQQIRIVDSETVSFPESLRRKRKKLGGKATTKPTANETAKVETSWLSSITGLGSVVPWRSR